MAAEIVRKKKAGQPQLAEHIREWIEWIRSRRLSDDAEDT